MEEHSLNFLVYFLAGQMQNKVLEAASIYTHLVQVFASKYSILLCTKMFHLRLGMSDPSGLRVLSLSFQPNTTAGAFTDCYTFLSRTGEAIGEITVCRVWLEA